MSMSKIVFEAPFLRRRGVSEADPIEATAPPLGRVPRVSRLMALAIRFDSLIRRGVIADYATLAQLGEVSRARITQIMNLLYLAPDIQEDLLHLPQVQNGRNLLKLADLQPIAADLEWKKQRARWSSVRRNIGF